MFATVEDVKLIIGNQYEDAKIQAMLDYTVGTITNIVGDISYSVKEETIDNCKAYSKSLFFNNIQIHEILEVNNKPYTDKYTILEPQNRQVIFCSLFNYIDWTEDNGMFVVKYLSGYKTIPADLKLAQILLVQDMLVNGISSSPISKYKMGPRTVEYAIGELSGSIKEVDKILNRYRLLKI